MHLVYVYWEPIDEEQLAEVASTGMRLRTMRARGKASPRLHALSYSELWSSWEAMSGVDWLPDHVAALRERYELSVPG